MKKFTKQALAIVAIAALAVAGCKKQGSEGSFNRSTGAGGPFNGADSIITGNIIASRTLSPGKVYKLEGVVYVTGGAKLTIKPGTVLTSGGTKNYKVTPTSASKAIAGMLVITRGSSINAVGTPDQPIVFTSPKAAGARVAGDFGGVILLGNSTTNRSVTTTVIEGLPTFDENGNSLGVDITYGGSVPADNSGTIEYTRIEYAGFKLDQDIEVNGLTLGGVGSGTTLDHIQVSYGADDAFEFFGGTVNASYLLAVGNDDDDFDTDFGYSGHIQYAIGLKDPSSTHSLTASGANDSNGIESDNDGTGTTASPATKPVYTNFTILGYASQGSTLSVGNRWRRNSDLSIQNSIVAGYNVAVDFISGTQDNATNGGFTNNSVHGYTTVFNYAALTWGGTLPRSLTGSTNLTSTAINPDTFVGLGTGGVSPFYTTAVAPGYSFDNLLARSATSIKGAVLASNYDEWASGWANFTPQTSVD